MIIEMDWYRRAQRISVGEEELGTQKKTDSTLYNGLYCVGYIVAKKDVPFTFQADWTGLDTATELG